MIGVKTTGLVYASVVMLACAAVTRYRGVDRPARTEPLPAAVTGTCALVTAAALLVGAFWYARNAILVGNPLGVVKLTLGGRVLLPGPLDPANVRQTTLLHLFGLDAKRLVYKRGATERDGYHNFQLSSRLGATLPKDGRLDLQVRWWKSHFDFDNFDFFGPADGFGSKTTDNFLILSAIYDQPITSWWSQKLTIGSGADHRFSTTGGAEQSLTTGLVGPVTFPFTSDVKTRNHRIEWQHNFQIGKPLLVTAGYQFREDLAENPDFGVGNEKKMLSSHAGFAQAQVNFLDRVLFTGGFRQDSYNVFGAATTYRVTGGYLVHETGTKLRGSYGTGFRAPTIDFLFFTPSNNPNLKPEKSRSMDVGVDQKLFHDKLLLSAGYFWNRFRDLIQSPPPTFIPQNIGNAGIKGWGLSRA